MKRKILGTLILMIFIGNVVFGNMAFAISSMVEEDTIAEENSYENDEINKIEKDNISSTENENNSMKENGENDEPKDNSIKKNNTTDELDSSIKQNEDKSNEEEYSIQILSEDKGEEQVIKDGTYRISMHSNNHMIVEVANGSKDIGANVQLGEWVNKENEYKKFKIEYDKESGYYTIKNINSGNVLDVQNGGITSGTNVWQHKPNGTDAQKWKIVKNDDGSYSFVSKKNGLYLNIQNGNIEGGGNVQVYSKNNSSAQSFDLICLDDKAEKVLENGIYKIALKANNNIVLQTKEASKVNGGNIETGKWLEDTSNVQKRFKITYNEDDGYYTIENLNSGKVLDSQNGGTTNATNVWQYAGNYTDAQRWKIEKNSDGSYSFINKKSGLYLDVANGETKEGLNIQIYEKTNDERQKFNLIQLSEKSEKIIEDGTYRISVFNKAYSYLAFEIANASKQSGANVQLGEWSNKQNEKNKFKITYDEVTGYYTIESILSGNSLDVQNGEMTNGTNVWQYVGNNTDAQKWKIEKNDDGSYCFISKKNGLYLNIQGTIQTNANIQVYEGNNEINQKFQLISLDNKAEKIIEDGIYKIETFSDSNKVVEIKNASSDNCANVQLGDWTETKNAQKKFKLTYNEDDGYYTIENLNSGKVFDSQNGGMIDGTNIWQYTENYTDAQRWKIEKNDDGSYSFVCKKSGLYLTKNNGNIEIHSKLGTDAQKFKLERVERINAKEYIEPGTYKIVSASNNEFAINIKDASRNAMANVELGKAALDTLSNEFNISVDERGYYTISSVNSGNVLDVQNGGMTSGTSVWQYTNNASDAQKWNIIRNEDGTYSIVSKKNGLYIDIQNGNVSEGANIQVYEGNNTQAQKFNFIKQGDKTERYIEDGLYKVLSKANNSIGLDIEGANKQDGGILQIWKYENVAQQQFNIVYKNGYYYIININSNKAMQAVENRIKQYEINYEDDSQKWSLNWVDGQYYSIVSKSKGLCINIPKVENGTDLNLETNQNIDIQLFKFENAGLYIDESKYPGIKAKIDELKAKHPNWNFEILYTGINFYDAVNGEYSTKSNCLVDTSVYHGEWIAPNPYSSGVWYSASEKAVAYFMDSRNFLNEVDIFQFQDLNGYDTNAIIFSGIQQQVNGTFLENYANDIHNACYKQNVNAYYVIARLFQEQGRNGTAIGKGMDGGDGKTYYNPFNIGAKLGNDYATALAKAKECGWDSMEKALVGGIDFLKENWLENYQNTLYQNKFDIDTRNGTELYKHEYMQNVSAAYSEARTLRNCYSATNTLDSEFTFIIPVYENMPEAVSEKPTNSSSGTITSNSGPMDVKVVNVSSTLNLREDASTSANIITKLTAGTELLSIKRAVNGNWHQVVTDDGIIGYVSGDYLEVIPDRTNCNIQKVVKTESGIGIKIRIGPSIYVDQAGAPLPDGTVVTSINTGTYYIDDYAWDRVILDDGRQVFAPSDYLK